MAALELTPPEQSRASAGKHMGLSRQGVASCCHHDTYLHCNQRQPICLGLEAGLGDCTGNHLSRKHDRLLPHRCSSSFQCSVMVKGRSWKLSCRGWIPVLPTNHVITQPLWAAGSSSTKGDNESSHTASWSCCGKKWYDWFKDLEQCLTLSSHRVLLDSISLILSMKPSIFPSLRDSFLSVLLGRCLCYGLLLHLPFWNLLSPAIWERVQDPQIYTRLMCCPIRNICIPALATKNKLLRGNLGNIWLAGGKVFAPYRRILKNRGGSPWISPDRVWLPAATIAHISIITRDNQFVWD